MTEEITISDFMDKVYDLSSIGLEATFFVIEENQKYIETKKEFFKIDSLNNFIRIDNYYVLGELNLK